MLISFPLGLPIHVSCMYFGVQYFARRMSTLDPSTGLTCVTCRLVFKTPDLQREHYRTEWHRYNLKRQVSELPPVSDEQFREKVLSHHAQKDEKKKEEEDTDALFCTTCRKQMKSRNAYENHVASNKHKENETKVQKGPRQPRKKVQPLPEKSEVSEVPSSGDVEMNEEDGEDDDDNSSGWETDDGEPEDPNYDESKAIPITACLFCPQTKPTKEESLHHMHFHHGFLLPDKKYLVDEDGMLKYLGLKIGAGRFCIMCPELRSPFTTIDACQKHMRDKEHCKIDRLPKAMIEYAEYYDYEPMYADGNDPDSEVFYDDGVFLSLPSGRKIGSREMMHIFRQRLRLTATPRLESGRTAIDSAKGIVPALAWTNARSMTTAKQAARDFKYMERSRRRVEMRVSVWSSKLFKTRGRVGDN